MGRIFLVHLDGKCYTCKHCQSHLALSEDVVSKSFHSRHGKAYLFNKVVNVMVGPKEDRPMMTGLHTVSDIFCVGCGSNVGWIYVSAYEKGQKYKEGKFILERLKFSSRENCGVENLSSLELVDDGEEINTHFSSYHSMCYCSLQKHPMLEFKVSGPDGSHYWANHDSHAGISDAEDA